MIFKNLTTMHLPTGWRITAADLEARLARLPLVPPSGAMYQSHGWDNFEGEQVIGVERHLLVAFGTAKRDLPGSVVKREVKDRVAELAKVQGFAPGRKQIADIKERVIAELLPRAFVKYSRLLIWFDIASGLIHFDSTSNSKIEDAVVALRLAFDGEFAVVWATPKDNPALSMHRWLIDDVAPSDLLINDQAVLVAESEPGKPTVRYAHHPLENRLDVTTHLLEGKQVKQLGLRWVNGDESVETEFVLTDAFRIKGIKCHALTESDAPNEKGSAHTDFLVMVSVLRPLFVAISGALPLLDPRESRDTGISTSAPTSIDQPADDELDELHEAHWGSEDEEQQVTPSGRTAVTEEVLALLDSDPDDPPAADVHEAALEGPQVLAEMDEAA